MEGIYSDRAPQEVIDLTIETYSQFLERLDKRWADGRGHVTGTNISAADFHLLSFYTSIIDNKHLSNPEVSKALSQKLESLSNVSRVIDRMKREMGDTIDKLPPS